MLYFTELSSGGIWWPERNESLWALISSLYSNLVIYSVLFLAGVLGNCQPRIHFDPATEDYMFEMHCAFPDRWWWSTSFLPTKKKESHSFICLTLELRTLHVVYWNCIQEELCLLAFLASFACFLCKKACMRKTRCVRYELLENNAGLQNI